MNWSDFIKKHKIKIVFLAILVLVIVIFAGFNLFGCSGLNEAQCREDSSCIPLGEVAVLLFQFEHEEVFDFKECVERVEKYDSYKEVVMQPQTSSSVKFSKECSCCCGEGTVCEEKPYPET